MEASSDFEHTEQVLNVEPYQFEPVRGKDYVASSSEDEESESDNGDLIADINTERKRNTEWYV